MDGYISSHLHSPIHICLKITHTIKNMLVSQNEMRVKYVRSKFSLTEYAS